MALYRQGRIPGSVYTGRGQEAVAAAAGYALGPDDVVAPLNRELACHFARGARRPTRSATSSARRRAPRSGATGTCTSAPRRTGVFPLVSMLGDLVPVVTGRGARVQEARAAAGRDDLPRRRRVLGRRHARGPQPRRRLAGTRPSSSSRRTATRTRLPWRSQMVNTNIAAAHLRRLVDPRRARRRHGCAGGARHRPGRGRAGPQRQRPAGGRGAHGADARPRRTRRLALRAGRDARGVLRALRPGGAPRRPARARRLSADAIEEMREAATAEVAAGLAEAEQAPAPDPATIEDGVYAAPPWP